MIMKLFTFFTIIVFFSAPQLNANELSTSLKSQIDQLKNDSVMSIQRMLNTHPSTAKNSKLLSDEKNFNFIGIDAIAINNDRQLLIDMESLGLIKGSRSGRIVSGLLPSFAIKDVVSLQSLNQIFRQRSVTYSGSVISQGAEAIGVSDIVYQGELTGKGVKIGIISDSYDCLSQSVDPERLTKTADIDKATGDLHQGAYALQEANDCLFATDEGRALMQIIHDIAPDAELVFQSGINGIANTINGILSLANDIRVNIIVDDTFSGIETYFQDGPVAQVIDQVSRQGITYITAAGNNGRNSYHSVYREAKNSVLNINAHDFDPGLGVDIFQAFTLRPGNTMLLSLQWANPAYSVSGAPGASTDMDVFIVNEEGTEIITGSTIINIGKDPNEFIFFANPENSNESSFNIMITRAQGKPPELLKYVIEGEFNGKVEEYNTNSGTIVGRTNSQMGISVGAANYQQTSAFGAVSPILQFFSSAGGEAPILYDRNGQRLTQAIHRQKPDIVGPDNINTTFFPFGQADTDPDNDGFPNFLGTSASAPHIAAAAALLLEVNPNFQPRDILTLLKLTATDMTLRNIEGRENNFIVIGEGVDNDSGSGFVDVAAAIELAKSYPASPASTNINSSTAQFNNSLGGGGSTGFNQLIYLLILFYFSTRRFLKNDLRR